MRLMLIIIILCLMVGQVACGRKKTAGNADANVTAESGGTVEGGGSEEGSASRSYLDKGKEFYKRDQDEKAVEAFQEAIKLDPELAEAHFRLGMAYDSLGKDKEAEEAYKKAVDLYKKELDENDENAEAHYNLGQT